MTIPFDNLARLLVIGLCWIATPVASAQGLFWDDTAWKKTDYVGKDASVPSRLTDIPTRNRVLIYNAPDQATQPYGEAAKHFTIQFIGLKGESPQFKLIDYYRGQVFYSGPDEDVSIPLVVPTVLPYSGGQWDDDIHTGVDVHAIPIPPDIGPVVGILIETAGTRVWKIDKVVADGRTFSFDKAHAPMYTRFSTTYPYGALNGDFQTRNVMLSAAMENATRQYADGGGIFLTSSLFETERPPTGRNPLALYDGPRDRDDKKTITVRLRFGSIPVRQGAPVGGTGTNGGEQAVYVMLRGRNGESAEKLTTGPIIFRDRFVSFSVAGDFDLKDIRLRRPSNVQKVVVEEAGVVVEEGFDSEYVFQDEATLEAGVRDTDVLTRFGKERPSFTLARLSEKEARLALLQRSDEDVFYALTDTPARRAAMTVFFDNQPKVDSKRSFTYWFLSEDDYSTDAYSILRDADPLFASPEHAAHAGEWMYLRAKLKHMIDMRKLSLQYLETLRQQASLHWDAFSQEFIDADKLLNLGAATTIDLPTGRPSDGDAVMATLFGTFGPLSVTPVYGPAFGALEQGLKVIGAAQAIAGTTSPDAVNKELDNVGSSNELSVALVAINDDFRRQQAALLAGIDDLRSYIVRDPGLLEDASDRYHEYSVERTRIQRENQEKRLTGGPDADVKGLDQVYLEAARQQIRARLLSMLLPIRGVLYGQPAATRGNTCFPPGETWPSEDFVPRGTGCYAGSPADDVLAYSAYRVYTVYGSRDRRIEPQFHAWRLALGDGRNETPLVMTSVTKPADIEGGYTSAWGYVRSVYSPNEVFNLIAFSPRPERFVIEQDVRVCDRAVGGLALPAGQSAYQCFPRNGTVRFRLPPWRSSKGPARLIASRYNVVFDNTRFSGNTDVKGTNWVAPGEKSGGNDPQFAFDLYYHENDDGDFEGIVPDSFVVLTDR